MPHKILLVDNKPRYLAAISRHFKLHGFQVLTASSPVEAQAAFETKWFHLAIIDVRLEDDSNPNDISGLLLARNPQFSHIPKIIITNWPTWQSAVQALKAFESMSGHSPAVDYVAKDAKFDILLETVRRVLSEHSKINWDLSIDWHGFDKFSLLNRIEPNCESELAVERVEELEDLFRRLFHEKKVVNVDRAIWHDKERVSLLVTTFDSNNVRETFAVTCGTRLSILNETAMYREYAPKGQSNLRASLTYSAEVNHFAANAYMLPGTTTDNIQSLSEVYAANQGTAFGLALEDLFTNTLTLWGDGSLILKKEAKPDEIYLDRLNLTEEELFSDNFVEKLHSLASELQRINMEVDFRPGSLNVKYGAESFSYPDPLRVIDHCHKSHKKVLFIRTPGRCAANTIMVDPGGHTWVTDFAYAGLAPSYWNCVEIEAEIRFDWTAKYSIQSLHDLEVALVKDRFSKFNLHDFEVPLRKSVKAIISVRKLALKLIGKDITSYHIGILFQALSRVMSFNASTAMRMPNSELIRIAHAFISISIIGEYLLRDSTANESSNLKQELRIDPYNREIWLGATRLKLQPRSFEILCILFGKPNQLCSRAEIIEHAFNERYDETDESQVKRLNSAIFRLRQQLETDPDKPQYVLTEPKGGYRLNPSGKRPQ